MMAGRTDKDISLLICSCLDNFGFKKENVSARSHHSKEAFTWLNCALETCRLPLRMIHAGSSAEGLALSGSDMDVMWVFKDAVCVDQGSDSEHFTMLETDYTNTAPGYTKAVCTNQHPVHSFLNDGICKYISVANYPYVSSTKFINVCYGFLPNIIGAFTTNGPAITSKLQCGTCLLPERDAVFSVNFYGSDNLLKWANRRRLHNWPSGEMVKQISEIEGFIVPIGDKQSENQFLEWRICYTSAEKELVSSLSDIQIKLYVLLKLLAKSLLKPVCKALTSYVVKNVVFWIVEGTPPEQFTSENLVGLLLKSLHFIKCCLENNHFPNYMIPDRNLLRGAVNGKEKQNVINFLSNCLIEGGTVILRVPKLYQCVSYMVTNPKNVIMFGKWRDEVEKQINVIILLKLNLFHICSFNKCSDITSWFDLGQLRDRCKAWDDRTLTKEMTLLRLIAVPDGLSLLLSGKSFDEINEIFRSRLQAITFL